MTEGQTPKWLIFLEKKIGWIAIPNISLFLITLQAFGFFVVESNPDLYMEMVLDPAKVFAGDYHRLLTFLALPTGYSFNWGFGTRLIFLIFALWFLYFILQMLESQWGAFKTTFYLLISTVLMVAFSLLFGHPIVSIHYFISTIFLAAAALFPNFEILFYFVLPVKMKWLAWLSAAFVLLDFWKSDWMNRVFIICIFSNYLLFFGPYHIKELKLWIRRSRSKY